MARTPRERLARGVLTASAGNMAQGVAFCARRIGVGATIIAPDTAPATKIQAVERMGGRVIKVPFAEWWQTFETRSYPGIDATFIHAFDDPDVMAGNGTIALELLEDLPDLDAVVIPWGGEDCHAASLRYCESLRPECVSMPPRLKLLLRWRHRLLPASRGRSNIRHRSSMVSAARPYFPVCSILARKLLDGSLVVTLTEAANAIKMVAERNRMIIEGAAACAVAACLSGRVGSGKIVAIVSGGNIDLDKFAQLVS